jgi:hypothetical protein
MRPIWSRWSAAGNGRRTLVGRLGGALAPGAAVRPLDGDASGAKWRDSWPRTAARPLDADASGAERRDSWPRTAARPLDADASGAERRDSWPRTAARPLDADASGAERRDSWPCTAVRPLDGDTSGVEWRDSWPRAAARPHDGDASGAKWREAWPRTAVRPHGGDASEAKWRDAWPHTAVRPHGGDASGAKWRASGVGRRALLLILVAALAATAATRPRYGGVLRVEMRDAVEAADPPQAGEQGPGRHLAELSTSFSITRWESGRRASYVANDAAAGGRPFLDAIEVEMGRSAREQAMALELGRADVVEAGPAESRRPRRVWSSAPVRLGALIVGGRAQDPRVGEALSLAIDRAAIHAVLLQKHGEPSAALLPQWLSGYAFLFPAAPDLVKARALLAGMPASGRAFSLGYDASEPQARAVAERIALNARDAGLLLAVTPQLATADIRLAHTRIASADAAAALAMLAAALGLPEPARAATPEALYHAERALLETRRAIPLYHLPEMWGASPRLRLWRGPAIGPQGDWRFDNLWLEAPRP